jgi:hypothetical protein
MLTHTRQVKALLGLYQCVAAVPSVYNVSTPPDLPEYHDMFVIVLKFGFNLDILLPPACFGSYYRCGSYFDASHAGLAYCLTVAGDY